ncbi:MAG: hypothetical protein H6596_08995 [Flavobacteriales bacterium]|nr:hypothetical protein [Flavobacteriales bacterium]
MHKAGSWSCCAAPALAWKWTWATGLRDLYLLRGVERPWSVRVVKE